MSESSLSILSEFGGDSTEIPEPVRVSAMPGCAGRLAGMDDTQIQLMRLTKTDE